MNQIVFYDSKSTAGQSQAAAYAAALTRPNAILTDVTGLDAAGINALFADLVTDKATIDEIVVAMSASTFGYSNLAELSTIVDPTEVATGTAQSNAVATNIVLASTASAVDDFYNGMFIHVGDHYRLITDYVGSTKTCTVLTTTVAVASGTYSIYTQPDVKYAPLTTFTSKVMWDILYPTFSPPAIILYLWGIMGAYDTLSASTYDANTITVSKDANKYNARAAGTVEGEDWYIGLYSGTNAIGQIKKIASNTSSVITLAEPLSPVPTGSISGYIDRRKYMLWDKYLGYAVATYLGTDDKIDIWRKLIDKTDNLNGGTDRHCLADDDLILEYVEKGKVIYDAIARGIVS
jgi:hypothetical protein